METSFDGMDWTKVHEVAEPTDPSQPNWAGQPAVCSFDIPDDKLEATSNIRYIKLTIKSVFGSRGCLSQLKIFADTLAESGIDLSDDATYYQNIKEGKVGVSASYDGQAYEAFSTMSQDGSNYLVTEFKNNSGAPLTMRYYTAAHQYRNPEYCHSAGVDADGSVIYATRTTPTADPPRLVWVSAATIAASVEGAKWTNPGYTNGMARSLPRREGMRRAFPVLTGSSLQARMRRSRYFPTTI